MERNDLTPGSYLATVTCSALAKTGSGNFQLAVGLDIHHGEQSVPMTAYLFFSDAALETTAKALAVMGWDPDQHQWKVDELNPFDPYDSPLRDAKVRAVLEMETDDQGNKRLKVRWINRPDGGLAVRERMAPNDAAEFASRLRQHVIPMRGPQAAAAAAKPATPRSSAPPSRAPAARPAAARPAPVAPPAPAADATEVNYDDIPF